MRRRHPAFTLIELMLVMAIISLLAGMFVVGAAPLRERTRQRVCSSNLHQIGLALAMYRADYNGIDPVEGQPAQGWQLGLPPLTWRKGLYDTYVKNRSVLLCPSYHGDVPIEQFSTTYLWIPDENASGDQKFSRLVARRGLETPIFWCKQHNHLLDPLFEPRWARRRVIVLRLNGQVQIEDVPVKSTYVTW